MDDCLDDKKAINKDKSIESLFYMGRHWGITFIMSLQYPLGLPKHIRSNVDITFICRPKKMPIGVLYDNYGELFGVFERKGKVIFQSCLDACTRDYHVFVIIEDMEGKKVEDQIYSYKANRHQFKLCSKFIWDKIDRGKKKINYEQIVRNTEDKNIININL
jgi:hypothetical protein